MHRIAPALALPLLVALIAGCHAPPAGVHEATYVASDYAFEGPVELQAGWNRVTLVHQGSDIHHLVFVRLEGGHTVDDLRAAIAESGEALPDWATYVGGVNPGPFHGSSSALVRLSAGDYAVVCIIPDAQGTLHVLHGMHQAVTVVASERRTVEEPTSDVTLTLSDYDFGVDGALAGGNRTFRVDNAGPQVHEVAMARLSGNATVEEFLAAFGPNATGPPPGELVGGTGPMAPGFRNYFTVDLTPGRYVLLCFIGDEEDHLPHFAHGMVHEFTI